MRKKKTKLNENKTKIIFISSVLVVLFVIGLIGGIFLYRINLKKEIKVSITDERVEELYDNNYKIFYLLNADVGVTEGYVKNGDYTYYYLEDEVVSDIKSFNDIYDIIEDTYIEHRADQYAHLFGEETSNQYFSFKDVLYVKKKENVCKNMPVGEKRGKLYEVVDEQTVIIYPEDIGIYASLHDGEWKLELQGWSCQDIKEE